jgi:hypothetical protein
MAVSIMPHFEGVERLIKEDIVNPLDFSNSDYCIDCIKEKYAKHVKKGEAKRSARILEIIHIDICSSFPIKSMNDFDSFIIFTDDFRAMAIFIQLKSIQKHWINLRYLKLK